MQLISNSEKQTFDYAKKFATKLKGGEILALSGNLGAGKTVFTKGLAKGLGVKDVVRSPSFVLMKVYRTVKPGNNETGIQKLVHIDCYRIGDSQELSDLGWEELVGSADNLVMVEWGEKIKDLMDKMKDKVVKVRFNIIDENTREVTFLEYGEEKEEVSSN